MGRPRDKLFEKAAKNRGRPFWAPSDERVDCEAGPPPVRLTFNSPPLTWCSPALRVSAGKSGVGGGEWKGRSMQISVLFPPRFISSSSPAIAWSQASWIFCKSSEHPKNCSLVVGILPSTANGQHCSRLPSWQRSSRLSSSTLTAISSLYFPIPFKDRLICSSG